MIYFKIFMVFAGLICFSSCGNKENNKMIIGNWTGKEWLVNGSPSNRKVKKRILHLMTRAIIVTPILAQKKMEPIKLRMTCSLLNRVINKK
jgi:hypothetical protein